MFCVKCGQRLADSARFCPSCGEPVAAPGAGNEAPREGEGCDYDYGYGGPVYEEEPVEEAPGAGSGWRPVGGADSGYGTYDRNDAAMNERLRRDRETREANAPKGMPTASIVLGIISLVLVWVPGVPFVLGLIGLILGLVGRARGERFRSTAGITLSLLGMVFSVVFTVLEVMAALGVLRSGSFPGMSGFGIDLPIGKNFRVTADIPDVIRRLLQDLI